MVEEISTKLSASMCHNHQDQSNTTIIHYFIISWLGILKHFWDYMISIITLNNPPLCDLNHHHLYGNNIIHGPSNIIIGFINISSVWELQISIYLT